MTLQKIIEYCLTFPNVFEDYSFHDLEIENTLAEKVKKTEEGGIECDTVV